MRTDSPSPVTAPENVEAQRAWNGTDGDHWAAHDTVFDRSLAGYAPSFRAAAAVGRGDAVLDVGCGTGGTSRDAARAATPGPVLGVDLSSAMLARARARAREEELANVEFVEADAQVHPFAPGTFDVALSRTGAMFFGDPTAAFGNIARALRPGGRLALLVWQPLDRNEWFQEFRRALAAGRDLPTPPPDAPGPFALSDPARTDAILTSSGFVGVASEALAAPMWFGADADAADSFLRGMGFTRGMLQDLGPDQQRDALDSLRASIDAHEGPAGVEYGSSMWLVTATTSAS
jgi:SAM-dependent methyltransferase